jgi:hypothetical protein
MRKQQGVFRKTYYNSCSMLQKNQYQSNLINSLNYIALTLFLKHILFFSNINSRITRIIPFLIEKKLKLAPRKGCEYNRGNNRMLSADGLERSVLFSIRRKCRLIFHCYFAMPLQYVNNGQILENHFKFIIRKSEMIHFCGVYFYQVMILITCIFKHVWFVLVCMS